MSSRYPLVIFAIVAVINPVYLNADVTSNNIRIKRNVDDAGLFTSEEEESCDLKDSCVVDNVTSHKITVRWPCCAGSSFQLTSKPSGFSRNHQTCECININFNPYEKGIFSYNQENRWREEEKKKESEKTLTITDCLATFDNYCPYGNYLIIIKSRDQSCSLTQTTLPAIPKWNEKKAISEDKIRLSWQDTFCTDHQKPIYRINWMGPDLIESMLPTNEKEMVLSFLLPNTKYTIKLSACDNLNHKDDNTYCSGNTTVEITTKPGPPSEPQNLTASAFNSSAILLSWEHPLEPRGFINGYSIACRKGRRVVQNAMVYGNKTTRYLVTMLQSWTSYTCAVKAFNVDSDDHSSLYGRETTANAITKPEEPSQPLDLKVVNVTSDGMSLSWKRPSTPRGPLDGYFIKIHNDNEKKVEMVSPTSTEHCLKGLSPGTDYSVTVFAFNYDIFILGQHAQLNGTPSIIAGRTRPAAPSSPRDVRVARVSPYDMLLKWKRPATPGGPIDGYVIRVITDESEEILRGSSLYSFLNNLSPSTNYTVAIFAFNKNGDKRLDGEEVFVNTTTGIDYNPFDLLAKFQRSFENFREDTSSKLSQVNQLLNETLQSLRVPRPIR